MNLSMSFGEAAQVSVAIITGPVIGHEEFQYLIYQK